MELKTFIQHTIEQIVEGVSDAQSSIASKGGIINPASLQFQKEGQWNTYQHAIPQEVAFDVGLTSTDKTGTAGGIGVFLGAVTLGSKGQSGTEETAVTKVKFTVPLVLPPGKGLMED